MMDAHKQGDFAEDGSSGHKENFDAARTHLQSMSRLEVEMNEALSLVLKEEDLQRMLVSDLNQLILRNAYNFNASVKVWMKPPKVHRTEVSHKSTQVDERDDYGSVNDLVESPRDFNPDNPPIIPVDFDFHID
jgi:hypothetical protein